MPTPLSRLLTLVTSEAYNLALQLLAHRLPGHLNALDKLPAVFLAPMPAQACGSLRLASSSHSAGRSCFNKKMLHAAQFCAVQVMGGYLWWPPMEQLGLPEKATAHTLQTWRALQKTLLGARTN